jgi:hypothetical protein
MAIRTLTPQTGVIEKIADAASTIIDAVTDTVENVVERLYPDYYYNVPDFVLGVPKDRIYPCRMADYKAHYPLSVLALFVDRQYLTVQCQSSYSPRVYEDFTMVVKDSESINRDTIRILVTLLDIYNSTIISNENESIAKLLSMKLEISDKMIVWEPRVDRLLPSYFANGGGRPDTLYGVIDKYVWFLRR